MTRPQSAVNKPKWKRRPLWVPPSQAATALCQSHLEMQTSELLVMQPQTQSVQSHQVSAALREKLTLVCFLISNSLALSSDWHSHIMTTIFVHFQQG